MLCDRGDMNQLKSSTWNVRQLGSCWVCGPWIIGWASSKQLQRGNARFCHVGWGSSGFGQSFAASIFEDPGQMTVILENTTESPALTLLKCKGCLLERPLMTGCNDSNPHRLRFPGGLHSEWLLHQRSRDLCASHRSPGPYRTGATTNPSAITRRQSSPAIRCPLGTHAHVARTQPSSLTASAGTCW